mmetsp:Transcript_34155/g.72659  ORF Transcript_34155/g.72659 Transcript_34155/m.72659 type:complete len:613 (+) Transcript_34155:193-2031(+)
MMRRTMGCWSALFGATLLLVSSPTADTLVAPKGAALQPPTTIIGWCPGCSFEQALEVLQKTVAGNLHHVESWNALGVWTGVAGSHSLAFTCFAVARRLLQRKKLPPSPSVETNMAQLAAIFADGPGPMYSEWGLWSEGGWRVAEAIGAVLLPQVWPGRPPQALLVNTSDIQEFVSDLADGNNMPSWCRGCDSTDYLQELQVSVISNLFSTSNWMMLGVWAGVAGDLAFAFACFGAVRRLDVLLGYPPNPRVDSNINDLRVNFPDAEYLTEDIEKGLFRHQSHLFLDITATTLLPRLLDGKGNPRLSRRQLSYFAEALATSQDMIPSPAHAAPPTLAHDLKGLQRAGLLRECWARGVFPPLEEVEARRTEVLSIASLPMAAVYVFNGKVASSALRRTFSGNPGGIAPPQMGRSAYPRLTWFSFVRDPLERLVSGFFEVHRYGHERDACQDAPVDPGAQTGDPDGPGAGRGFCRFGINPLRAAANNEAHRREVLNRFEAMVSDLEAGRFRNQHVESQSARLLLRPDKGGTVDFIGDFGDMEADWEDLTILQESLFGAEFPPMPARRHVTSQNWYAVFNISVLPWKLVKRVCNLYRNDYCCLGLPFPRRCGVMTC